MKDLRSEIIKEKIKEQFPNQKAFAEFISIPYTTLRSMLERGIGNAAVDNVIKVCRGLGIKVEDLEQLANNEEYKNEGNLPELNEKDERNIQKELEKIINDLSGESSYAAFDGQSIDDIDEEDRELLKSSLENSLRLAKRIAKQKYTPKKYKK